MKKSYIIALIVAACFLSGCGSLLPKHVEFFQKKVKAVPELSDSAKEHQKQAADYVAHKVEEAKVAAIDSNASPSVKWATSDASIAANALTLSLGPPAHPWTDTSTNLEQRLHLDLSKYESQIQHYSATVEPEVGKKIEGTGLIQMSYFTYIGCLIGLCLLVWFGIKIYGMINPVVGLGSTVVGSVASSVVSRGFSEVVAGGEAFKNYITNSALDTSVKNYVLDLFTRAHQSEQSQDVQSIITQLTAEDPAGTPKPPVSAPSPASAVASAQPTAAAVASAQPSSSAVPAT